MRRLLSVGSAFLLGATSTTKAATTTPTNPPAAAPILWVVDSIPVAPAEQALLASAQGLLNTSGPNVWIRSTGLHARVLESITHRFSLRHVPDVWSLLAAQRTHLSGFLLCSVTNESLNRAFTISGPSNAVVADVSLASRLSTLGLPQLADLRETPPGPSAAHVATQHRSPILIHQPVTKPLHLRDLAVALRVPVEFPESPEALTARVRSLGPATEVLGWGRDEHEFVQAVSRGGGWVIPADWALNLSAHRWLASTPTQPTPPSTTPAPARPGQRIVCFVISDGDNVQWLLGGFTDRPGFWSSPRRGTLPVTWELAPRLADLAPAAHAWLRDTASPLDSFIGGPSGGGYYFPHETPDPHSANRRSARALARAGLRITSVLNSGGSPDELESLLADPAVDAVFYKDYAPYNRRRGALQWIGGKPVVAYRFLLWEQARADGSLRADWLPAGVARAIANAPEDPTRTIDAFSLVQVHAWSFRERGGPLEAVHETIQLLPPGTRVVGAAEFVALLGALKPNPN